MSDQSTLSKRLVRGREREGGSAESIAVHEPDDDDGTDPASPTSQALRGDDDGDSGDVALMDGFFLVSLVVGILLLVGVFLLLDGGSFAWLPFGTMRPVPTPVPWTLPPTPVIKYGDTGLWDAFTGNSSFDHMNVTWPLTPPLRTWYGASAVQGRRSYMEDTYSIRLEDGISMYGIYDGHGGGEASSFLRLHLQEVVHESFLGAIAAEKMRDANETVPRTTEFIKRAVVRAYHDLDDAYLQLANKMEYRAGSTAVLGAVIGNALVVANVGDSRAVMSVRGLARVMPMSKDHKPAGTERRRVEALQDGYVSRPRLGGVPRVQGILATSRSFGDRLLKPYVISVPEVTEHTIVEDGCERGDNGDGDGDGGESVAPDTFLLLGSDGLFDVFSNQESIDYVRRQLREKNGSVCSFCRSEAEDSVVPGRSDTAVLRSIAENMVTEAHNRGSTDNIAAMIVMFGGCKVET
eukprot:TRINITY_DN12835_c0_g1_i1.p1 TRINITY_DN12835_c0_g1~~TRINITY_DN12835_c0_g1_i1.p1  ORF type:complete len:464 (-),score=70.86 TRINITY_DN12835_c0_g1_i1:25-1416(-)